MNVANTANLTVLKADLDSVGVTWRFGQDIFDDSSRLLACSLIGFEDNVHIQSWSNLISLLSAHNDGFTDS